MKSNKSNSKSRSKSGHKRYKSRGRSGSRESRNSNSKSEKKSVSSKDYDGYNANKKYGRHYKESRNSPIRGDHQRNNSHGVED